MSTCFTGFILFHLQRIIRLLYQVITVLNESKLHPVSSSYKTQGHSCGDLLGLSRDYSQPELDHNSTASIQLRHYLDKYL